MAGGRMTDEALALARFGFYVFPLIPGGNIPAIPKSEGGNGCLDATRDEAQIEAWWTKRPNAGIGIAGGRFGDSDVRIAVLDIDVNHVDSQGNRANGEFTWRGILDYYDLDEPETMMAYTPRGGRHLYFLVPTDDLAKASGSLGDGLDIRPDGYYVAAPPTRRHIEPQVRQGYDWADGRGPFDGGEILELPPDLIEEFKGTSERIMAWRREAQVKFDVRTVEERIEASEAAKARISTGEGRPGDFFNQVTDLRTLVPETGGAFFDTVIDKDGFETFQYCRPGVDDHPGVSVGRGGLNIAHMWTDNWVGFTKGENYDPFGWWAAAHGFNLEDPDGARRAAIEVGKLPAVARLLDDQERRSNGRDAYAALQAAGERQLANGPAPTAPTPPTQDPTSADEESAAVPPDFDPVTDWAYDDGPDRFPIYFTNDNDRAAQVAHFVRCWDVVNDPSCAGWYLARTDRNTEVKVRRDGNPLMYRRDGRLVTMRRVNGELRSVPVDIDTFGDITLPWFRFVKKTVTKFATTYDPDAIVDRHVRWMLAAVRDDEPAMSRYELRGVAPLPLRDGNDKGWRTTRGYDVESGFYLDRDYCPAPEHPTPEQLATAIEVAWRPFSQFLYADTSDRANTFALSMTPLLRQLLPAGADVPLAAIDAYEPATGKTTLATAIASLRPGRFTFTGIGGDDSHGNAETELAKTVASMISSDPNQVVVIDNVNDELASSTLDRLLTGGGRFDARRLGSTEMISAEHRLILMATGNHLRYGLDMASRLFMIRLRRPVGCTGRIEEYTPPEGWLTANPAAYVVEHHGEIIAAQMTIYNAWVAAGRPLGSATKGRSFDTWSRVVGGIAAMCGFDDFLANDAEHRATRDTRAVSVDNAMRTLVKVNEEAGKEWRSASASVLAAAYVKARTAVNDGGLLGVSPLQNEMLDTITPLLSQRTNLDNIPSVSVALGRFFAKIAKQPLGGWLLEKGVRATNGRTEYPIVSWPSDLAPPDIEITKAEESIEESTEDRLRRVFEEHPDF